MDEQIQSLNRELAFPGVARLQAALRKRGIIVPLERVKTVVEKTGTRQVLQPPPKYEGNITAGRLDDRWVADLLSFESRPAQRPEWFYRHVVLVQDIFSRYLWAEAISTKDQTRAAFERILDQGRKPRELNTDKATEFTGRDFQAMLARRGIQHRLKEAINDLATVDRAMGTIKDMIAKRMGEMDGDWLSHLQPVIDAYNQLDHSALHENAPGEIEGNDELRFRLRVENANRRAENVQLSHERAERIKNKGAFRTLLQPMALKRRKGVPNWSSEVHAVQTVGGGLVTDTAGQTFDTRQVLPVAADSGTPTIAAGGNVPRDDRRRILTRVHLQQLKEIVSRAGSITVAQAAKAMGQKQGFKRALGELRLNFRGFVNLWPDFIVAGNGPGTRISLAEPVQPRAIGTLDDFRAPT